MNQWAEVLATKPEDLSLSPHFRRELTDSCKFSSDRHTCNMGHVNTHTCTKTKKKCEN